MTNRRDFLIAMLGTNVIAVLPKESSLEDAAPFLDPYAVEAPEGITYQWVSSSICGEPNPMNIQARLDNGWTFVSPVEHPTLATSAVSQAVERGGLILMQKQSALIEPPKALHQRCFDEMLMQNSEWKRNEDGTWNAPKGFVHVGSSRDKETS